jgi:hypothetical protein
VSNAAPWSWHKLSPPGRAATFRPDRAKLIALARGQKSEGALIWIAISEAGDPIDLVARAPRKKPASLVGRASMLNPTALRSFSISGSVRVDSDPIAWLKAGARGVLGVDLDRAALSLMDVEAIEVATAENARRLRAAFEKLVPSITVAKPEAHLVALATLVEAIERVCRPAIQEAAK